jgi:pimeloyl-ACP methyl ester carboxylesterase
MTTTIAPVVRFRDVDGVRIRYSDSGGSQQPTVVLTSPWPESCCRRSRRRTPSSTAAMTPSCHWPNAKFLDERLTATRLVVIDAGHFVWEEAPAEYASTILESTKG